nr:OmpA family protein [uncultured Carboxylicivirga sp.]
MLKKLAIILILPAWININGQSNVNYSDFNRWQLKKMYKEAVWLNDYITASVIANELVLSKPESENFIVYQIKALIKSYQYEKAYEILGQHFKISPYTNGEIAFFLAELEKMYGNYEEAKEILIRLRRRSQRIKMGNITRERIDNSIAGCDLAISYRDTVVYTKIRPIGNSINTDHIEFAPKLISEREMIFGAISDPDNLNENLDIQYQSKRGFKYAIENDSIWTLEENVPEPFFNYSDYDTGDGTYSIDGLRFYYTKCARNLQNRYICHLYMSKFENGLWSNPIALNKNINKKGYSSSQPTVGTCYDPSLEVIYFVSDKKGGAGGNDIWYIIYNKNNQKHSKPFNAGVYINTSGDEITPFYDLESHALFFSSNGLPTVGGYDIFYCKGELVNWQNHQNIGYPINSSFDDIDYFRNESGKRGLVASNRSGEVSQYGQMLNNIFAFEETAIARVFVHGKIETAKLLKGQTLENLTDQFSEQGILANQLIAISQISDTAASLLIKETTTNANGEFGIWLDRNHEYRIQVKDTLVAGGRFSFNTKCTEENDNISLDLKPVLIFSAQPIEIKDIYYEFDKTELTFEAKTNLDSTLLNFIQKYPELIIRIISHTDNLGSEKYNQRLSEKRADNVVNYLISKGANPDQLRAEGRGEREPIAKNENADGSDNIEGRTKNRRTEFVIEGIK